VQERAADIRQRPKPQPDTSPRDVAVGGAVPVRGDGDRGTSRVGSAIQEVEKGDGRPKTCRHQTTKTNRETGKVICLNCNRVLYRQAGTFVKSTNLDSFLEEGIDESSGPSDSTSTEATGTSPRRGGRSTTRTRRS